MLKFSDKHGNPLRKFSSIEEHDEHIVAKWNNTVRPDDKVYHLGDVAMHARFLPILDRLNGTKVLIKGNHDNGKLSQYMQYFKDVRATHVMDRVVLSHVPLHPYVFERWKANIHGHTHDRNMDDPRYYNVSCEVIDYQPIPFWRIRESYREAFS